MRAAEFIKATSGTGVVLVVFFGEAMAESAPYAHSLEAAASLVSGCRVVKADIVDSRAVAHALELKAIPTTMLYINGEHIDTKVGVLNADMMAALVLGVNELDY